MSIVLSQRLSSLDQNIDVLRGLLTLGRNSFTALRSGWSSYTEFRVAVECPRNGVTTMVSRHSTGKSVFAKRIYCGWRLLWPDRPGLIFDMAGNDHRLSKFPSKKGYIFSKSGEYRFGFTDLINLTPAYLKEISVYNDTSFGICWEDLDESEWEYLLEGADKPWVQSFLYILTCIPDKGDMRLADLIKAVELAAFPPRRPRKGKKSKDEDDDEDDDESSSRSFIPREISRAELQSMLKALRRLHQKRFLLERDDPAAKVDLIKLLGTHSLVVVNFHLDESVPTRLYTGHLLRKVYEHYEKVAKEAYRAHVEAIIPWIVVEEFDKLAPAPEQGKQVSESPGSKWIHEIVTKGMKHGFRVLLITQNLHRITKSLRDNLFNDDIVLCAPTAPDIKEITMRRGQWFKKLVHALDGEWDDHMAKEWIWLTSSTAYTVRPAASQCEFHDRFREFGRGEVEA